MPPPPPPAADAEHLCFSLVFRGTPSASQPSAAPSDGGASLLPCWPADAPPTPHVPPTPHALPTACVLHLVTTSVAELADWALGLLALSAVPPEERISAARLRWRLLAIWTRARARRKRGRQTVVPTR